MTDELYMRRALDLARKGAGFTSPNPMVGTVIVKNGTVIGEGYHRKYGEKHAEAVAINGASGSVAGATLYCNLEPCSYTHADKHQPPCTDQIIRDKIARVVVSNIDPNPRIDGRGIELLRDAGVEVVTGVLAKEGAALNEAFFKYITTGIPFVTVKIAQSLDGRIATSSGHSRWITDIEARRRVHEMRGTCDAVLVGIGTVKADNPSLSVRHVPGRDPVRVILDSGLCISLDAHVVSGQAALRTIIITTNTACREKATILRDRGVEVVQALPGENGRIELGEALALLGRRKITSLLVEGGGRIFTSFIREKLFDKLIVFVSPLLIGSGIDALQDLKTERVENALRLKQVRMERLGEQMLVEGYREALTVYDRVQESELCLRV